MIRRWQSFVVAKRQDKQDPHLGTPDVQHRAREMSRPQQSRDTDDDDDPFALFDEWNSEAHREAFKNL